MTEDIDHCMTHLVFCVRFIGLISIEKYQEVRGFKSSSVHLLFYFSKCTHLLSILINMSIWYKLKICTRDTPCELRTTYGVIDYVI